MTSLDAQLAAFKHRAQNQPVLPRAVVKTVQKVDSPLFSPISFPPSPSEVGSTPEPGQPPRKRQKKSPVVYSQPRDTGVGQHLYTQLTYAVDYLKHHSEPISAERIASYLSLPTVTREFITSLQNNSRITYHADTDLYEFRPLHNIRNKSSLLTTLANQPRGEGLSIKEIKDGYPNVEDDLTSLEFEEGHILVIRGKKDGLARMVWYNDPKLNVTISEEFKEIYHGLKVPEAGDLPRELEKLGMMPASVDPRTMKKGVAENSKEAKKRRGRRRGKITNTHLVGILRDYTRNSISELNIEQLTVPCSLMSIIIQLSEEYPNTPCNSPRTGSVSPMYDGSVLPQMSTDEQTLQDLQEVTRRLALLEQEQQYNDIDSRQ